MAKPSSLQGKTPPAALSPQQASVAGLAPNGSVSAPRLGILYPGHSAEGDYLRIAAMINPPVSVEVVTTQIGEDVHREDALRDIGDLARLRKGARDLRRRGIDAALWACTSGSFVFGLAGARKQAFAIQEFLGVPVSSTSLAFVAALQTLGIKRAAIAATYPEDVALLFKEFLVHASIVVVHVGSLGIMSGIKAAAMTSEEVLRLVQKNDHPDAQAILVPDTALHTAGFINKLEAAVNNKTVLTANQVTIWEGLRLVNHRVRSVTPGMGSLFCTP